VRGRLYEDEGDGHGPFGLTELTGGRSSRTFWLEQRARGELTRQRTHESLRVYGLPDVANVEGAEEWSFEDGLLEIRVEASWRRIEIEAPEVS
jgi:alpha-glucosidase